MLSDAASRKQMGDQWWAQRLWMDVAALHQKGDIAESILIELKRQGFSMEGPAACLPPDLEVLRAVVEGLSPGAVGGSGPAAAGLHGAGEGADRFGEHLSSDLKRAAPEIFKTLLDSNLSCRDWLTQFYIGNREGAGWIDLWNAAVSVDFKVTEAKLNGGMGQVWTMLATDDLIEIYLRRLASFVYGQRTGDWSGANFMLAVRAPGSEQDIAPSWLINESTTFSKAEYQRSKRVRAAYKYKTKGEGKGGKDGKGGTKGDKKGGGGSAHTQG